MEPLGASEFERAFKRYELGELQKTATRVDYETGEMKELMGKDLVMFIGNTGAGKSTITNGIVLGASKIKTDDMLQYIVSEKDQLKYNGRKMFEIGHNVVSHTGIPGFYPVK